MLYQRNNFHSSIRRVFFNFQSPSIFIEFDSMKRDRYRKVERIGKHLIYVEFPRPMINLSRVKPQSFPNHTRNKVAHPRRTYNLNLRQPNDTPLGVEYYVTIDDSRMHGQIYRARLSGLRPSVPGVFEASSGHVVGAHTCQESNYPRKRRPTGEPTFQKRNSSLCNLLPS